MKRITALSLTTMLAASMLAGCSSNEPMNNGQSSSPSQNQRMMDKQSNLPTTYTVKVDDTLKSIARKYYGSEEKWPMIYYANVDKLPNAQAFQAGLELKIPRENTGSMSNRPMNRRMNDQSGNSGEDNMDRSNMNNNSGNSMGQDKMNSDSGNMRQGNMDRGRSTDRNNSTNRDDSMNSDRSMNNDDRNMQ